VEQAPPANPARAGRSAGPLAHRGGFLRTIAGVLVALLPTAACPGGQRPLWLVVGPPTLIKAMGPLASFRRAEPMEVVLSPPPVTEALRAAGRRPSFLLLVGDDQAEGANAPWRMPAPRRELYRWRPRQACEFAADALYGDLDGDLVPDVPVGRIPGRTAEEVARIARKIVAFENRPPCPADLRILAWAGAWGYDETVDRLLINVGFSTFHNAAPSWSEPWAILAAPGHPLCGWPASQCGMFARELRAGALASVFMGHATADSFHSMVHAGRSVDMTAEDLRPALAEGGPAAPAFLISCDCGDFTRARPCLAERLLAMPGGPVAAVGSTTESHPLTNYFTSVSLLGELGKRTERVGELWLQAQRRGHEARNPLMEAALAGAEGSLEKKIDTTKLRRDQLLMYTLLGDPATRMKFGRRMDVQVRREAAGWCWSVARPKGAERLLVDHRPLSPQLPAGAGPASAEAAAAAHSKAVAAFAFRRLATLGSRDEWQGTVADAGVLRLVAVGPERMYVASGRLQPPAPPAAEGS